MTWYRSNFFVDGKLNIIQFFLSFSFLMQRSKILFFNLNDCARLLEILKSIDTIMFTPQSEAFFLSTRRSFSSTSNASRIYGNKMQTLVHLLTKRLNHIDFNAEANSYSKFSINARRVLPWQKSSTADTNFVPLSAQVLKSWKLFSVFIISNTWGGIPNANVVHPFNYYLIRKFIVTGTGSTAPIFNAQILFKQWRGAYIFILNLFYTSIRFICLGRQEMRTAILALNWNDWPFSFSEWRNTSKFFYMRPTHHAIAPRVFFQKFMSETHGVFFIIDCQYHHNAVVLLSNLNAFMISPINLTYDMWRITFPLPIIASNFFSHYLVIVFLLDVRRAACALYYDTQTQLIRFFYLRSCLKRAWAHIQ